MDRLSELPELTLVHILSFLKMRDVVRTAVLSKRWRHLWSTVPNLDFSDDDLNPYQNYVDFVNRTLLSRGTSKIRRLKIGLFLDTSYPKDYEGWFLYAVKNNVEELFLEFNQDCCYWCPPWCLYRNSSFKTLTLWSCKFVGDVQISWNLLTKLTLRFSVLWDQNVHKIMVGAPKLEFLELDSCYGYDDLNIDSPSLRTLIVRESESVEFEYGPIMRISAPNVRTLRLSGSLYRKCILMNVQSVVNATLSILPKADFSGEKNLKWQQDNLMELVRSLKHVENLTLGACCVETLALREKKGIPSQISTRKCVTLSIHMKEDDLLGTVNLLKGSPALQMLIIDMEYGPYHELYEQPNGVDLADSENFYNSDGANYLASQAKHVKCLLHHLKTVKITQFVAETSMFPFLEFILKNGKVLENVVIIAKRFDANSPEYLLKVAQILLNLPRASSRAVIKLLN